MNLLNRIERLEATLLTRDKPPPDVVVRFIEPIQDAEGLMRPGKCAGGLRIIPLTGQQFLMSK